MRNTIIRILYAAAVFCVSFILMELFSGSSSAQTTEPMSSPVLPVVSMYCRDTECNLLHGYTDENDPGKMRPPITPAASDRTLSLCVNTYGETIDSVQVEVRDITGQRLIEQNSLETTRDEDGVLRAAASFTNLVMPDTEYLLTIVLQMKDNAGAERTVRYYTRITCSEDESMQKEAEEALKFAASFHEDTFDKTSQDDLLTWLEPDTSLNNNTLQDVTLHNSADEATWGNLDPEEVTAPVYSITDIQNGIYGIRGTCIVRTPASEETDNDIDRLFLVEEYYELRQGTDRFYLMDYNRTMNQIFNPETVRETDDGIDLGIADPEMQNVQSSNGDTTAFVLNGSLYAVQNSGKLLSYVFGFPDADARDEREYYSAHDIGIRHVDDDGSIDFIVYGYMNAGHREGETGVSFYHYSGEHHTIEEKAFVPVQGSWDLVRQRIQTESYYNADRGTLYLILENGLYEIDVNTSGIRLVEGNLSARNAAVSESGQMIACEEMENDQATGRIVLENLESLSQSVVAVEGKTAIPLGFIGEDLIYGTVDPSDETESSTTNYPGPMDHVYITDSSENILEDYHRDGYYVVNVRIEEGQITLSRVQKTGSGSYVKADDDQIVSGVSSLKESEVTLTYDSRYQTTVQLPTGGSGASGLRYIRPEEIIYEGSRVLTVRNSGDQETGEIYYVFDCSGLLDSSRNMADAVAAADASSTGYVIDDSDRYLWRKDRPDRSEIDSLTVMEAGSAMRSSQAVCIEAMLALENVHADVEDSLSGGQSAKSILQDEMTDAEVVDVSGCSLDEVLYYVGLHHPVLVLYGTGEAVLLVGYGPENVEVFDPSSGSVYLLSRSIAEERFTAAGSSYISYISME